MLGLVAMIVISLSNRLLKLPTGLEKSGRSKTAHGAAALFTAILKGRIAVVQSLLNQGVNVNVRTISGKTPLMAAAYKGYSVYSDATRQRRGRNAGRTHRHGAQDLQPRRLPHYRITEKGRRNGKLKGCDRDRHEKALWALSIWR
jgi:ankyrin repeat protein